MKLNRMQLFTLLRELDDEYTTEATLEEHGNEIHFDIRDGDFVKTYVMNDRGEILTKIIDKDVPDIRKLKIVERYAFRELTPEQEARFIATAKDIKFQPQGETIE